MKTWISTSERMPPDEWHGLVCADVRPDKPVFAHRNSVWYRKEFPYADDFSGKWRQSLLVSETLAERAKVLFWLDVIDEDLYPPTPDVI